ncbi:uncharacterized protein C6orf62 homolog [Porites lutea]|uniref:uncharacterized protein C6orf62 homolog n=1 Tax=Porites lutea TaxID=51062 RepID=UPI003CC5165F
MADPASRKSATLNRLRSALRRKRESLADQFDFKIYMAVVFKDKKKKSSLFEVADVLPVMTNNFEDTIMKGVQEEVYSLDSSKQFLDKDVVQLHSTRYQPLRKDIIGCVQEINFFLWPRNDIDKIICLLFSRWKGDENSEYRLIQAKFEFDYLDYEKQLLRLISRKEHNGLVINNSSQSLFLFVDKHHLQTDESKLAAFKISSICLHVPQDQLTHWGSELREDVLAPLMPS